MTSPYRAPVWKAVVFRALSVATLFVVTLAFTGELDVSVGIGLVNAAISTVTYWLVDVWWPKVHVI